MKFIFKIIITTLTLLIFTACSTSKAISTHLYNNDFGLVKDYYADALLQQEYLEMNTAVLTNPNLSTELSIEPNTFLAEDYVAVPEVITYKYKFDPKFYSHPEWRTMNLQ